MQLHSPSFMPNSIITLSQLTKISRPNRDCYVTAPSPSELRKHRLQTSNGIGTSGHLIQHLSNFYSSKQTSIRRIQSYPITHQIIKFVAFFVEADDFNSILISSKKKYERILFTIMIHLLGRNQNSISAGQTHINRLQ